MPNITNRPAKPINDEKQVVFWIQVYNVSGKNKVYFHSPELYVERYYKDIGYRPHRFCIQDPRFKTLHIANNWGGSYYASNQGPEGDSIPTHQVFDISRWKLINGILSIRADLNNTYFDLWNIRYSLAIDERIIASIWVKTKGDVKARIGCDFWGAKHNRGLYSEWAKSDDQTEWKRIFIS